MIKNNNNYNSTYLPFNSILKFRSKKHLRDFNAGEKISNVLDFSFVSLEIIIDDILEKTNRRMRSNQSKKVSSLLLLAIRLINQQHKRIPKPSLEGCRDCLIDWLIWPLIHKLRNSVYSASQAEPNRLNAAEIDWFINWRFKLLFELRRTGNSKIYIKVQRMRTQLAKLNHRLMAAEMEVQQQNQRWQVLKKKHK